MKYRTTKSLFPSANTKAENAAQDVYYAVPKPLDALTTIPKTAPVIVSAFSALFDELEAMCNARLTDWSQRAANATIMNNGHLQTRRAEALEIGDEIRKIRAVYCAIDPEPPRPAERVREAKGRQWHRDRKRIRKMVAKEKGRAA